MVSFRKSRNLRRGRLTTLKEAFRTCFQLLNPQLHSTEGKITEFEDTEDTPPEATNNEPGITPEDSSEAYAGYPLSYV